MSEHDSKASTAATPGEISSTKAAEAAATKAEQKAERKVSSDYGENQIKVLTDIEHVRLRPGMYIGGYNARGLHHLVYEIVDNSIDEALAGHAHHIEVKINADGS